MRVAALGLILLLAACTARAPSRVTSFTYASPYSPNHPFSEADREWMRWVEQQSQGQIHIRPLWSETLLSSDESMIELRHGVADIGLITPIYQRGGAWLLRTQTGFYAGATTIAQQVGLYGCLIEAFPAMRAELSGLHVLAVQGGALPGILTRTRPVRSLSDLAGLRIRSPTELLSVLRDLGADPIDMPMDQVYSALAKGMLDGVIAPADTLRSLHFAEVARYFSRFAIPRGAYPARAMNEQRWRALSTAQQRLLTASTAIWEAALSRQIEVSVAAGEAFGRQHGVQFIDIAPDEQRQLDRLYDRDEERSARALTRYGIDGIAVFNLARRIATTLEQTGQLSCAPAPLTAQQPQAARR